MNTIRNFVYNLTHGRLVKRGLTWRTVIVVSVITVAGMYGIVALQDRLEVKYDLDVVVTSSEIASTESGCEWQFHIRVANPNERKVSVVSFELDNIDDSARGTLASVAPAESVERIYRLPVEDCAAEAADRDPGDLKTTYRLSGSTTDRSVKVPVT